MAQTLNYLVQIQDERINYVQGIQKQTKTGVHYVIQTYPENSIFKEDEKTVK